MTEGGRRRQPDFLLRDRDGFAFAPGGARSPGPPFWSLVNGFEPSLVAALNWNGSAAGRLGRALARYALLGGPLGALTGCTPVAPDLDQSWGLGEARIVHERGADMVVRTQDGDFSIGIPLGVTRHAFALVARNKLVIGAGSRVIGGDSPLSPDLAYVASFGGVRVNAGAELTSIYALGAGGLVVDPGARISGYMKVASETARVAQNVGGLGILVSAPTYAEEFRWKVDFSAGGETRIGDATESAPLDVPPGRYRSLVVDRNATMLIHSGQYIVEALEIRPLGTLNIDNLSGPVYVWIRNSLTVSGVVFEYAQWANVLFGYAGAAPPVITEAFHGTLVSPRADIVLPRTMVAHRGAFFGRNISVAEGATIKFASFFGTIRDAFSPASAVCQFCALAAAEAMRDDCCNGAGRQMAEAAAFVEACGLGCASSPGERSAGCSAQCAASSIATVRSAEAQFDECLQRVWSVYEGCEAWYNYWPRTCAKVGYPASRVFSCGPSPER